MNVTRDEIQRIVNESIEELFTKDLCLLQNDVSERAVTHKLAEYLQHRIPHLNVDCEYNRNATKGKGEPKAVYLLKEQTQKTLYLLKNKRKKRLSPHDETDDLLAVSTYPDIIVHRRMTNDYNLLVVELKKRNSKVDHDHDRSKLKAFSENTKRNSYHYRYGVFILLDTGREELRRPELAWFSEGENEQEIQRLGLPNVCA
jgi:hypothetical protein